MNDFPSLVMIIGFIELGGRFPGVVAYEMDGTMLQRKLAPRMIR